MLTSLQNEPHLHKIVPQQLSLYLYGLRLLKIDNWSAITGNVENTIISGAPP